MYWQTFTILLVLLTAGCGSESTASLDSLGTVPGGTTANTASQTCNDHTDDRGENSISGRSIVLSNKAGGSANVDATVTSSRGDSTAHSGALTNNAAPVRSTTPRPAEDDYRHHVAALLAKLPGDGFHVVIEKPFVVIGDERPEQVERYAQQTIQWAVKRLKQDFFQQDPRHIIDIWLFKDKDSYDYHVEKLFGRRPHTPFGYYSSSDGAMVMNIGKGSGTLVHEIVHPFVEVDFPKCPSWFNEGLGSLYEQCGDRNGKIYGYTNWRLPGLQQAIRDGKVPTFETLCSTTTHQFYREDPGTNYAQARYLCYYLQEQELLRTFYRRFRSAHGDDPTGYQTLQSVLGETDMAAFQKRWEKWVLELRFPE